MSEYQGKFVWHELMTTDLAGAAAFYGKAIGWDAKDSGMPDRAYTLLSAGPAMVAGMMAIPPAAKGARPGWMGYIGVPDVDAAAAQVKAAGGSIHHASEDIPNVGRFAVVADPGGAVFVIFKGASDQEPAPVTPGTPGHIGWNELQAADREKAWDFYSGQFHWTKADAMDMGAMGVYQIFSIGGVPSGAVMTKTPQSPMPFWLFYFNVEDIDAAIKRVTEAGGKILHGPSEVPGGSWIAQCMDPQGAVFAIVGPRR